MKISAAVAVILLAVVVVFQIALAAGVPFGKAAWGGRHDGPLPTRLRIASGVAAILIYPLIIAAVLDASRLIDLDVFPWNNTSGVMWMLSVLFMVGGLANLVSRSPLERYWAPVSLAIASCCAFIASSL